MNTNKSYLLIGNSRWHWATKKNDTWHFSHTKPNPKQIEALAMTLDAWAAVGPIPNNVSLNPNKRLNIKDIPLKNSPPWLGIDRALAGWGAFIKAKAAGVHTSGLLVADAGTVLSLNRITASGEFDGGQLIPGLQLQLTSMSNGAKNLQSQPFKPSHKPELFPFKTDEAMQRGCLQALVGTILEAKRQTKMPLWLCGGDAPVLINELIQRSVDLKHHPNLVLEGMVAIQNQINSNPNH